MEEPCNKEEKTPLDVSCNKYNGKIKINGIEGKTPFLIGVAGGTASGKVSFFSYDIRYRRSISTPCASFKLLHSIIIP